jgi:hypothetical protein
MSPNSWPVKERAWIESFILLILKSFTGSFEGWPCSGQDAPSHRMMTEPP